jgi:hypothetical protein
MKTWRIIVWDSALNTYEVDADNVEYAHQTIVFTVGSDPRTVGIDENPPVEVARFITENVVGYYPLFGKQSRTEYVTLVEAPKR